MRRCPGATAQPDRRNRRAQPDTQLIARTQETSGCKSRLTDSRQLDFDPLRNFSGEMAVHKVERSTKLSVWIFLDLSTKLGVWIFWIFLDLLCQHSYN
jgi:hypothetical protein